MKLGAILWRDSVKFSKDFSDSAILEVILLESRSISSHLGRRVCASVTLDHLTGTEHSS